MLDIGIGTGRTGWTFAPLVNRYVGIDYAPPMTARARQLHSEDPNVTIVDGDARDLSGVGGPFDFVLFSFNGIDAAGHEDRLKMLEQVRSVLKPTGHFLFSSHSVGALPLDRHKRRPPRRMSSKAYRAYAAFDDLLHARRIDRVNATIDLDDVRRRGWTQLARGHRFTVHDYYVDPVFQVGQLREAGLEVVVIYDLNGREIELPYGGRDPWLDYLCRPLPESS